MELQDAFKALGLGSMVTSLGEIKTTYFTLMKAHHSDRRQFWPPGLTAIAAHAACCEFTNAWDCIQAYHTNGGYQHSELTHTLTIHTLITHTQAHIPGRNGDQGGPQAAGNSGGQRGRAAGAPNAAQPIYKLRQNRYYMHKPLMFASHRVLI
jgi:hypothetical protein